MNTTDLISLSEAKELIDAGKKAEALPRLYALAASYPQDPEIQELIRQCQQQPAPKRRGFDWWVIGLRLAAAIVTLLLLWVLVFPPEASYKEYATVAELYRDGKPDERAKVVIEVGRPVTLETDQTYSQYTSPDLKQGVVLQTNSRRVLQEGKRTFYVKVLGVRDGFKFVEVLDVK